MKNFDLNNRIKEFIDMQGISNNQFAKEIGISSSRISNIITHRNKPDSELLQAMLKKYRNLSMDWLLLGEGDTYKTEIKEQIGQNNTRIDGNSTALMTLIDKKDQKIIEMSEEIGKLKSELSAINKGGKNGPYNFAAEP